MVCTYAMLKATALHRQDTNRQLQMMCLAENVLHNVQVHSPCLANHVHPSIFDNISKIGRYGNTVSHSKVVSWLHMDDLWFIIEVQSLLNSGKLQKPVYGHVVQAVHVKMAKMNCRAWSCNDGSTLLM